MADSITLPPQKSPTLRRRNSISTSTASPDRLPGPPQRTNSLELVSLKSPSTSYTSLRDVLPSYYAAVNSPTASAAAMGSGCEISIRNRLVKQAAWAYLQPMSSSPNNSAAPHFFHRFWHRLSSDNSCFSFLYHRVIVGIARIFHRIFRAFRGHVSPRCCP